MDSTMNEEVNYCDQCGRIRPNFEGLAIFIFLSFKSI
ncbi:uncharacterized protein METZ01_LOCUS135299 [marine metagenome]|uniref:Uncharacterized protein n=1 Tax=marine metagenome TaxID=408172 RepID=A0A381YZK5_9ZZZZ